MKKLLTLFVLLSIFLFADGNTTKAFEPAMQYVLNYDRNTTCLVRHFKVYKEPKWVGKVKTRAGKEVYFSSPKSLFEFYHRPGKWFDIGVKSERDFAEIVVTDYETLKPINAETSFFIYGSQMISPAGDDLVAIKTKERAETFSKKYNGKRIFKFDKVSDSLIRLLNGRI